MPILATAASAFVFCFVSLSNAIMSTSSSDAPTDTWSRRKMASSEQSSREPSQTQESSIVMVPTANSVLLSTASVAVSVRTVRALVDGYSGRYRQAGVRTPLGVGVCALGLKPAREPSYFQQQCRLVQCMGGSQRLSNQFSDWFLRVSFCRCEPRMTLSGRCTGGSSTTGVKLLWRPFEIEACRPPPSL